MTVFLVKIIAIITMTLDHISSVLGWQGWDIISYSQATHMRYLGRIAFPIFAFLIANGWEHSKDRIKYFSNLVLFTVISQIPYVLTFYPPNRMSIDISAKIQYITNILSIPVLIYALSTASMLAVYWYFILNRKPHASMLWVGIAAFLPCILLKINYVWILADTLNVLYTMALGMFAIYCYESFLVKPKYKWWKYTFLFGSFAGALLLYGTKSDYGIKGVALILLFYTLRKKRILQVIGVCIWAFVMYCLFRPFGFIDVNSAFATCTVAPLIYFYNNKKGVNLKYFFYAYYPAHLLVLGAVNIILKFKS